jgi:hypothetical protein
VTKTRRKGIVMKYEANLNGEQVFMGPTPARLNYLTKFLLIALTALIKKRNHLFSILTALSSTNFLINGKILNYSAYNHMSAYEACQFRVKRNYY